MRVSVRDSAHPRLDTAGPLSRLRSRRFSAVGPQQRTEAQGRTPTTLGLEDHRRAWLRPPDVTGGLDVFVSLSDRPTGQDAVADDAADIGSSASSATKALALLDCFRQNSNPMGVTELARRTGLPKSTAFRLLTHLEEIGYVGRDGRRYRSGWLLFELGTGVNSIAPVRMRNISLPHMADLFAQTRQTVHLGALHGREIIHVARMRGAQSAVSPIRFGGRGPATCSAMGKIILAHRPPEVIQQVLSGPLERMTRYSIIAPGVLFQQLRDARERGYAAEREETAIGLVAIAVPIHRGRSVVGALSIAARSTGFDEQTYLPALRKAAERIELEMNRMD